MLLLVSELTSNVLLKVSIILPVTEASLSDAMSKSLIDDINTKFRVSATRLLMKLYVSEYNDKASRALFGAPQQRR